MTRDKAVMLMMELLGANADDAEKQVTQNKGDRAKTIYLRELFKTHLQHITDYTRRGMWWRLRSIRTTPSECICSWW
jgi:hypothetical protein